jgi:excisionase family DNA binding protein
MSFKLILTRPYRHLIMVDRLLSTSEAAKALGISPRSLSRWVRMGKIRPTLVTPGGQARFDLEQLKRQMERPDPPSAE